jgi:dephospho-CoA kinase
MLVIGLTGGIGSGKSAVAERFAARGVPIIDTDVIAREVVEPGTTGLAGVVEAFGPDVLDAEGRLERSRLGARVFSDPVQRQRLEAILHPLIREEMARRIAGLHAPYCVAVIPLLLETGQSALVDRVLVVDAPDEERYRRVEARDARPRAEIAAIMQAQIGRRERLAAADDVLANDGDLAHLERQVEALHHRYLQIAAARVP